MKREQEKQLIKTLINDYKMIPYAITMTFLLDESIQELGDDIFYNQYFTYYNVGREKTLNRHQRSVENSFRITLNKLAAIVLETSNITRPNMRSNHPITFYEFQLSDKNKRKRTIDEKVEFMEVSPLHIHGTMLVPRLAERNLKPFIGKDTIHKFNRLGQSSEIKPCDKNIDRWLKYVSRDFSAPLSKETMHPAIFAANPDYYIESIKSSVGHREGVRNINLENFS